MQCLVESVLALLIALASHVLFIQPLYVFSRIRGLFPGEIFRRINWMNSRQLYAFGPEVVTGSLSSPFSTAHIVGNSRDTSQVLDDPGLIPGDLSP